MTDEFKRSHFAPHVNTQFRIGHDVEAITLELIEVGELRSSRHHEAFSLVFRGPSDLSLPQAVYRLHHDSLNVLDLFLVPIGQDKHGRYYESIFSQLFEDQE